MQSSRRPVFLLFLGAIILLLAGPLLVGFWVDWQWMGETGYRGAWLKLLGIRLGLSAAVGGAVFAFAALNFHLAYRSTQRVQVSSRRVSPHPAVEQLRGGIAGLLVAAAIGLGVLFGISSGTLWDEWLRFSAAESFGSVDPILNRDIGFFVFRYPLLNSACQAGFVVLVLVTLLTAVYYYLDGALQVFAGRLAIPPGVRSHLSALLGLSLLVRAAQYDLSKAGLLLHENNLLFGASYADVHARIPALTFLMYVAIVGAVGFLINIRLRAIWLPVVAVGLLITAEFTLGQLFPEMMQRFQVAPNEQVKERSFLKHHLDATRAAYNLGGMSVQDYHPDRPLAPSDLTSEADTLTNVRLWDYRLVGQAFQKVQGLRQYYSVSEVDVDRYKLNGRLRQVMVAPRELVSEQVQPQRWTNQALQYTHGYGLVMSAVNEADAAGRPSWLAKDLPLEGAAASLVGKPQIYYGLETTRPVIAPSRLKEFDYPSDQTTAESQYDGKGGISLGHPIARWLMALYLSDWNIAITDQLVPESRILLRRSILDRVARIAPFLHLDSDPYLVAADGRLTWLVDAYTVSNTYPYSDPTGRTNRLRAPDPDGAPEPEHPFNYIRNSVKISVDAYDGSVTFFAADNADPVLRCYSRAFPGLFKPLGEMAPALHEHLRYPEGLFTVQATKLARFHVTEPDVLYARSDMWDIPKEHVDQTGVDNDARMQPYYVVMRLPGEKNEEFALILPFKTRNGTTMSAWMTGRYDSENGGRLLLYRFPTRIQMDSPEQVDNAIQTDPEVSQTTTLLGQQGSRVRYGNLLVLPVGQSILFVKPLYLEATTQDSSGGIPELKRVILAERRGGRLQVVMRTTLRAALGALAGEAELSEPAAGKPTGGAPSQSAAVAASGAPDLASQAEAAFEEADRALKAGDWAGYGKSVDRARTLVARLRALLGREGK